MLTGILILTGCTTDTDATRAPETTGSTATSTSAETTPQSTAAPETTAAYQAATANGPAQNVPVPTLPVNAKEFSKDGLLAFAEYWYSTLGYAYETGDPGPMMAISDPVCPTCIKVSDSVAHWYGLGGWFVGGQMTVHQSTSTFHETPDGNYQAILMIQQAKVTAYNADRTLDAEGKPMKARADIVVAVYAEGQWTAHRAEHLTKD